MFKKLWQMTLAGALAITTGHAADAADIKVLTAGAMKAVVVALAPEFEAKTGHKLLIDNDTAGGLARRIKGGEAFDVTIITPAVIDELIAVGKVAAGTGVRVAKVGIGVAVKEGAPKPAIGTVDEFKQALLAARSVGYIDPKAGGSSGIYFDQLLEKLGIAEAVRAKAKLKAGGYVAELIVSGEVDLAVHQISEILPVKGVTLVGPLPAEIQNFTVYAAGVGATAKETAAAEALIAFLGTSSATSVLEARGLVRP